MKKKIIAITFAFCLVVVIGLLLLNSKNKNTDGKKTVVLPPIKESYNGDKDNHNGERCPKCKSTNVRTIIYGLVDMNGADSVLSDDIKGGRIGLGGCVVSDDSPEFYCNDCSYQWGSFLHK